MKMRSLWEGKNHPLNAASILIFNEIFKKGLDLLMLKILGLYVKGLQSYWPSNFENDLTPGVLESGPKAIADS